MVGASVASDLTIAVVVIIALTSPSLADRILNDESVAKEHAFFIDKLKTAVESVRVIHVSKLLRIYKEKHVRNLIVMYFIDLSG